MNIYVNKAQRLLKNVSYRLRIRNRNFSLVSQNCVGGVMYNFLGMEFLSPTINMFIEDMNFVKLAEDPKYYFGIDAKPYIENYHDPIDNSITYPQIIIDDVIINCLHYKSCDEACTAWNRRRLRVNYDNIFFIGNSWNMHENYELVDRIAALPYSIVFTYQKSEKDNCIWLKDQFWKLDNRGIIRPNITDSVPNSGLKYFEKYFDYVNWLNKRIKHFRTE